VKITSDRVNKIQLFPTDQVYVISDAVLTASRSPDTDRNKQYVQECCTTQM